QYSYLGYSINSTVSFAYNDSKAVKIFSIVNMCLHITCALIALIKWKQIGDVIGDYMRLGICLFLILFPVFVIPIFWITYLVTNHVIVSINLLFIILLLALIPIFLIVGYVAEYGDIFDKIFVILSAICFYAPSIVNILQTLLILLMWPINFY